MRCYFVVDTYIDEEKGRGTYDEYIESVVPIVERYGGEYIVRSEKITSLSPDRNSVYTDFFLFLHPLCVLYQRFMHL